MKKKEFYYDSADGVTKIHGIEWIPEGKPVCILQIVHGMAEYINRYDRLAVFLAEKGILVTGNDHLGHGKSIYKNMEEAGNGAGSSHPYGYFCHQDPATATVEDVQSLKKRIREENPGIPYLIIGHSMGSFILRNYLCVYGGEIDGAIIMGTGMQPKGLLGFSKKLVKFLTVFQGEKHKSALVNALAFGSYNKRIPHPVSSMDWLSRDSVEVARYNEDPLCGFTFTLGGFATLFDLIDRLHDKSRLEKMPKDLPVLFMAGTEDPVGDYGKAVEGVYQSFRDLGMEDVSLKLYENDRHELVNESDRELVWKDIYEWAVKTAGKKEAEN